MTAELTEQELAAAVRAQDTVAHHAAALRATGLPVFWLGNEMMTQALIMVTSIEQTEARKIVQQFWTDFLDQFRKQEADKRTDVIPFVRRPPANDMGMPT